ncbi:L10-interacting MYB domain-containing protein-like isoform X2 [Magnolia sinica]|uniref:L10-interacting MYB domain-containing protein-like isoform X2 n=1 Tax=Magnolia sinica TaxID=86752 RepID=UPI0026581BE6|nr:L10-interacting MYB domain-containing protein-like isoform X2 [Magnolia sinica]
MWHSWLRMNTKEAAVSSQKKWVLWSPIMDRCLAEQLVEQVRLGGKVEHGFMPQAWKEVVAMLNERLCMYLTAQHCKNRLKTWRKQYTHVRNLLDQNGFRWDDGLKCVIAEEQVWDNYCKAHPNAAAYRYKPIQLFNEMALIFGNDQTDKIRSRARAEIEIDESTPRSRVGAEIEVDESTPRLRVEAEVEIDDSNPRLGGLCILERCPSEPHDAQLAEGHESEFSDADTKGASPASERSGHRDMGQSGSEQPKKRKQNFRDKMVESLSQMAGAMADLAATRKKEDEVSKMRQLYEEVKKIPNINNHFILRVLEFFSKEPTKASIFLALDEELRREWLLMFVNE